jgi:hypothetical protein
VEVVSKVLFAAGCDVESRTQTSDQLEIGETGFLERFSKHALTRIFVGFECPTRHLGASFRKVGFLEHDDLVAVSDVRECFSNWSHGVT